MLAYQPQAEGVASLAPWAVFGPQPSNVSGRQGPEPVRAELAVPEHLPVRLATGTQLLPRLGLATARANQGSSVGTFRWDPGVTGY